MQRPEFKRFTETEIERLFQNARAKEELSFLFATLGIDSGEQDAGWQPIQETHALATDLIGLINSPLHDGAKMRLALLLYCHITEANFIYHCLYNMLSQWTASSPRFSIFLINTGRVFLHRSVQKSPNSVP